MKHRIKSALKTMKEKHLTAKFSMLTGYVFAAIKIIFAIFTSSFFFVISGIYSICAALARSAYLLGIKESKENGVDKAKEYRVYLKMALLILAGSTVYVIYMARLFFISSNFNYGMIPSITIAAVSFTELVLSIKNIIKAQGVLQRGLRCVCLTSSFTAIVLTQVALLSFAHVGEIKTVSFFNAVSGCAFGGLCFLIGLSMLLKYLRREKETEPPSL